MRDRPPIARRQPHALPRAVELGIPPTRQQHGWGPHRLAWHLGLPRPTIHGVLSRHRYPPEKQANARQTVFRQAEILADGWAAD